MVEMGSDDDIPGIQRYLAREASALARMCGLKSFLVDG